MLVSMALVGALLVPLAVVATASAGPAPACPDDPAGLTQGKDEVCCPNDQESAAAPAVTQGEIGDVCCADEATPARPGVILERDIGVPCCPDGDWAHWEWGGPNGQNLYYCEPPPEPPTTVPPATDPPAVSPATAAPKKAAAAAKPTFTG